MPASKHVPPQVGSPSQLLSIALAVERAAAQRYRELAVQMRTRGEDRLAALFEFLATIEEKHVTQVAGRASDTLDPGPDAELAFEGLPENFDTEEGDSSPLTPYGAFAIAMRNEIRAFTFYSDIAATASSEAARSIAEEFAKEELMHADLLRRERRKAYHAESMASRIPRAATLPGSLAALWAVCLETERRAAQYHRALAEVLKPHGELAAAFGAAAEDEEACAREAAAHLGQRVPKEADPPQPTLAGGRRLLEEAFERYSDITDRSADEDVMHQAQLLATRAVRRLFAVQLLLSQSRIDGDGSRAQ